MWERSELKRRGKAAFQANYWNSVISGGLLMLITGSGVATVTSRSGRFKEATQQLDARLSELDPGIVGAIVLAVVGIIGTSLIIHTAIDLLFLNPLEVGCKRFFYVNSREPAALSELSYSFKNNYKNIVKTTLLRDVYLFLWGCLFIIPGIVKAYSYRLVPFILAEAPNTDPNEAITLSRNLMNGNKWKAFLLDLSFIGWDILSVLTGSLVGIFYSNPYQYAANAELYKAIRGVVK